MRRSPSGSKNGNSITTGDDPMAYWAAGRRLKPTCMRSEVTPLHEDVAERYDPARERLRHRDYRMDPKLAALHAAGRVALSLQSG